MKKYFFLTAIILLSQTAFAQKSYFSKANYADSSALKKTIPALAQWAVENFKKDNTTAYFDMLFRLQLVAGYYQQSQNTLQQLIKLIGTQSGDTVTTRVVGFAYQAYLAAVTEKNTIADYPSKFKSLYNNLDNTAKAFIPQYFTSDIAAAAARLNGFIATINKEDSIDVASALILCKSYCTVKVVGETQPLALLTLAAIENQKYIHQDSVLVKMRDGATVSLTIYRDRKITTAQPVVLLYNIYAGDEPADCKLAVQNGYVGIVANTRGKRLSPEALEPFEHDASDAYDIIDWISKQGWCNGKLGMYGGSYLGFAQWSATKYLHPALKTIVPQAAAAPGIDFPIANGIFQTYMLRYLHYVMDNKLTDYAGFANDKKWDEVAGNWYTKGTSFRSLDTLEGRPNTIFQRLLRHPSYDSFWQSTIPQKAEFAKVNIPVLTTTGYYDDDQLGAMYYYNQYHQWNNNPDDYLLIGPFDHGGSQYKPSKILGGYVMDSVANISIIDIVFQWFDHVMKAGSLPAILQDRVNFEVMGTNQWRHVASLNKMHNDSLTFYLGNVLKDTVYSLLPVKPVNKDFINQQVDLNERTDLRFRQQDVMAFTQLIDSSLHPEKEKLVFVSEPVNGTFAISGALSASIDLSINKKDIDLVLDLYEQTGDGHFFALNESLQRASYSSNNTKRQLLQPGKASTININRTFIISKKLQKGSRIVITLGVNKSPNWQVNYGTGKDVSDETIADGKIPLQIKWYNSSYIKIPILNLEGEH